MGQFCNKCGSPLSENNSFCGSCGAKAEEKHENSIKRTVGKSKILSVIRYNASAAKGETVYAGNTEFESVIALIGPVKYFVSGIMSVIRGAKNLIKNKKILIPTAILSILWIVLVILKKTGFNPLPIKIMSFLTYAQGGISNNLLRAAGGLIGKGVFAAFFISFFAGDNPFKGFGRNISGVFKSIKFNTLSKSSISLIAVGIALVMYNFITGYATLWNSTACIAALLMVIRSFGKTNGFLRTFLITLTSKKINGVRKADNSLVEQIISGIVIGLALSLPLSIIPFVFLPYCIGILLIIIGTVMKIVQVCKLKQIAATAALLIMLMGYFLPIVTKAEGSDDEWAGTWTLKDIKIINNSQELGSYYSSTAKDLTKESVKATKTLYEHEFKYTGEEFTSDIVELRDGEYVPIHLYSGEFFKTRVKINEPPKYLRENEKVTLNVDFEVYDSYIKFFDYFYYTVNGRMSVYKGKEISDKVRVGSSFPLAKMEIEKEKEKHIRVSTNTPYGLTNGEIMGLEISFAFDEYSRSPIITYGHTQQEYKYVNIKVIYLYEWKYGINNMIINTNASDGPGETDVSVPAAIITSTLGIIAAAGMAATALDPENANNADKKGSTYKMYIQKDFGNKIRYNDPAVPIYARMAEITKQGEEIIRNDLTSKIEIFTQDTSMVVGNSGLTGNYMGAYISAQANGESEYGSEGIVSVRFMGEGGSFQNNVTFMLIGKAYITYPDIKSYSGVKVVDMIMGDNFTYEVDFEVCDFMELPSVKVADKESTQFNISIEKINETKYKAIIENKTKPAEKPNTLPVNEYITITAENDKEYAESQFCISLYPEGLSVNGEFEEDRLRIHACKNSDGEDLNPIIKPARLKVTLAVKDTDENGKPISKLVDLKQAVVTVEKLKGTDKKTDALVEKFKYSINTENSDEGIYYIEPQESIPEPKEPYYLSLTIKAEYRNEQYNVDVPVRLTGEKLDSMSDWNKEYELLKTRIKRYGISSEVAMILRQHSRKMSTAELRLISKKIIMDAIEYYTQEGKEFNEIADSMEKWEDFLGVLKWFGDQAFSYLMTVYTGPVGEAVITPAKEIMVALIGEVGTQLISGESFNMDNLQVGNNIASAFENYLMTVVGGENVSVKKAGTVLAGFAVFNMAKHYVMDVDMNGNRDFFNAITAAFGDLTTTAMKAVAGEYFGKFVKNPKISKKLEAWGGKWLRKYLPDLAWQKTGKDILESGLTKDTAYIITKVDFIQKYVEELCGMGAAKVYQAVNEGSEKLVSDNYVVNVTLYSDESNPQNDIKVSLDLVRVKDKLFEYIFNNAFGSFPFPTSKINAPDDPIYYSDNQ